MPAWNPPVTASPCQPPLGKGAEGTGDGLPRAPCALAMTEAERICVSFRAQSADWSWESVIPLHKGRGERIATASVRTGFAMTHYKKCGASPGGRTEASAPTEGLPIEFRRGRCPHRPASVTRGTMGGRPQGSPLRRGYKECDGVRNPPFLRPFKIIFSSLLLSMQRMCFSGHR